MRIIVFGASGQTGQKVIEQALNQGMEVTAFVRNPEKLTVKSSNLQIVIGEATDYVQVKEAMPGHDAVINCIGGPGTKPSTVITDVTRNIVSAMKELGINRIVQVSSAGIHGELTGIIGKLVAFMLRNPLKDHKGAYEILQQSGVSYTLARPMSLTNTPFTGTYRETLEGVPAKGMKISREDVAHFLLKSLQDDSYSGKSVGLAY